MNSRVALITFLDNGGPSVDNSLPSGPNYPTGGPIFGGGNYPSGGPVFPGRPVDPGYGQGGINYPSTGFPPGVNYPGNALPPGSRLPIFPYDPTKPVPPEGPSTKPIEPGDHFKLKCTLFGLILVRTKLASGETLPTEPEVEPQS